MTLGDPSPARRQSDPYPLADLLLVLGSLYHTHPQTWWPFTRPTIRDDDPYQTHPLSERPLPNPPLQMMTPYKTLESKTLTRYKPSLKTPYQTQTSPPTAPSTLLLNQVHLRPFPNNYKPSNDIIIISSKDVRTFCHPFTAPVEFFRLFFTPEVIELIFNEKKVCKTTCWVKTFWRHIHMPEATTGSRRRK